MYIRYIAESSGGEIFLTQKFNTLIICTAKIFQSMVVVLAAYITAVQGQSNHVCSVDNVV